MNSKLSITITDKERRKKGKGVLGWAPGVKANQIGHQWDITYQTWWTFTRLGTANTVLRTALGLGLLLTIGFVKSNCNWHRLACFDVYSLDHSSQKC